MSGNIVREKRIDLAKQIEERCSSKVISNTDKEFLNWLKIAERSFRFWDNEVDDIWNKKPNNYSVEAKGVDKDMVWGKMEL